jgi:hypothetical protein
MAPGRGDGGQAMSPHQAGEAKGGLFKRGVALAPGLGVRPVEEERRRPVRPHQIAQRGSGLASPPSGQAQRRPGRRVGMGGGAVGQIDHLGRPAGVGQGADQLAGAQGLVVGMRNQNQPSSPRRVERG